MSVVVLQEALPSSNDSTLLIFPSFFSQHTAFTGHAWIFVPEPFFSHIADWATACSAECHKKEHATKQQQCVWCITIMLSSKPWLNSKTSHKVDVWHLLLDRIFFFLLESWKRFPLSCVTTSPTTSVDFRHGDRHLLVCTLGNTVLLLDHLAWLCFNIGWTLNHRPGLSTLINLIYFNRYKRDPVENFGCVGCKRRFPKRAVA